MRNRLMGGIWRYMLSIPPFLWKKKISGATGGKLDFMTRDHRLVHHFIVKELPRIGEPISPEFVADKMAMPFNKVESIFDDLERL